MKKINTTYLFFYCAFLIVVCVTIFFDKWLLIYIKPIVPVSLIVLYINSTKKVNVLLPICLVVIIATDIFIYLDFIRYYDVIALLIATFYVLCVFLMIKFVSKEDIRFKELISPPLIIGAILIFYLIFSISELVLPKINNSIASIVIIVISMLMFSVFSFIIYKADRYEKSIYLFVAACCTLFVDALLTINELYYYTRVFTILINITEIVGIYFFTIFFIETKLKDLKSREDDFFKNM